MLHTFFQTFTSISLDLYTSLIGIIPIWQMRKLRPDAVLEISWFLILCLLHCSEPPHLAFHFYYSYIEIIFCEILMLLLFWPGWDPRLPRNLPEYAVPLRGLLSFTSLLRIPHLSPFLLVNACRYSTPGTCFPCLFPIAYLSLLGWGYWWGNQQPLVRIYYALCTARQWRHCKELREVSLAPRESPKIVPSLWFLSLLSFLSDSGLRLKRPWLCTKRKPRVPVSWPSLWHLLGASSEPWLWRWQAVGHLESWKLVISALPLGLPWQPSLQATVLLVLSILGCVGGITFPFWAVNIEISLRDPKWPSHPWTEIFLWEIGFHFQPPHLTA